MLDKSVVTTRGSAKMAAGRAIVGVLLVLMVQVEAQFLQASNPLPQGLDLSELSGLGLQLPADLADAGSAPAPAPEPVLPTGDLLSGLPLPGVDLSDPLGSLATGGGLDEIPQSDAANETTVDGSAEAVPVNGTTADNSAESETVSQNGVEGTLVVPNIVSCGNLPQCAGRALNDIGRLCDMCTEDCTCVDKDPPAPVFVPTLIPPSQPSTPDAQLKAPSVPLQAPTVRPTNPPVVPKPMEPVPAKPEVEKQFCVPNCPEMAERCAQCSMDCKSCLTKRPPGAPYGNGTFTGEGPQVNNTVTPLTVTPLPPGLMSCSPECNNLDLGGCDICTLKCDCADPTPTNVTVPTPTTFTGEGPQVNNTVTPGLPPGLMSCSPECDNLDLGGCDICTLACDCADPPKGTPGVPDFPSLFPFANISETKIGPAVISAAPIRARTANGTTREAASECFFLIGDYGRENHPKQAAVAQSMDTVARELCQPLAVLTVGDNFQTTGGLNSVLDKEFNESFVYPYRFQTLDVPWFTSLGNMDYIDTTGCGSKEEKEQRQCLLFGRQMERSPLYQMSPRLRARDPRWFEDRFYTIKVNDIEIFFADTSVFVSEYYQYPWAKDVKGGLAQQDPKEQLAYLESALADSTATWKLLLGHHPMHSNGYYGGYEEVTQALDPLIRRYNVTAYFNGHDHSQQHIVSEDVHYFTQGAGSVTHQGFVTREPALFESDLSGFTALKFDPESLVVYFFDDQGNGLYNYTIPRPPGEESSEDGAVASTGSRRLWLSPASAL